jgi:endoglucanase
MLSGHMDEISFVVTYVDDNGFLRFSPLGGFDPRTLVAQRVVVHGRRDLPGLLGTKPVHILTEDEKKASSKIEDFFIDLCLPGVEVKELVQVGDPVTRERQVAEIGRALNGKAFDDRVGLFVMISALALARRSTVEVFAVASVQEEVGYRGAIVAARNLDPDIGIALDVTLANDVPDAKPQDHVTRLGQGAAIKVLDSSVICNPKLVSFLRRIAEEDRIPVQFEVLPRGGTDTAALQRGGKGAAAGCVSIPTRYVHSVIETCHRSDIEAAIRLLARFIERAHEEDYSPR